MNSYSWLSLVNEPNFKTPKVSCFKHAPMTGYWDTIVTEGVKIEVINNDPGPSDLMIEQNQNHNPKHLNKIQTQSSPQKQTTNQKLGLANNNLNTTNDTVVDDKVYWFGTVVKIQGYLGKIRYEGYEEDGSADFWVYLFSDDIHEVGWCASKGKTLAPPQKIATKIQDWSMYLIKRLTGSRTLPAEFKEVIEDSLRSRFKRGMKLEVVDKNRVSSVRVATVEATVGGRLLVSYDGAELEHAGFWTHEKSPLVHPIGWAQYMGHELVATYEYATSSLEKVSSKKFSPLDASWDMFELPTTELPGGLRFESNLKLEAIDPLNLSSICVATVIKVLRGNYLMIGIDGSMCPAGSDWFCYHANSPYIFPTGFCKANNLELSNPNNDKNFNWASYLSATRSQAARAILFQKTVPSHGFEEGMMIEAVDLMQSRLVCVATITKVVGRLLRIHFNGWDETYDQWCDCESPDLFPLGWCALTGYQLEPPKSADSVETNNIQPVVVDITTKRRKGSSSQRRPTKRKKLNTTS